MPSQAHEDLEPRRRVQGGEALVEDEEVGVLEEGAGEADAGGLAPLNLSSEIVAVKPRTAVQVGDSLRPREDLRRRSTLGRYGPWTTSPPRRRGALAKSVNSRGVLCFERKQYVKESFSGGRGACVWPRPIDPRRGVPG